MQEAGSRTALSSSHRDGTKTGPSVSIADRGCEAAHMLPASKGERRSMCMLNGNRAPSGRAVRHYKGKCQLVRDSQCNLVKKKWSRMKITMSALWGVLILLVCIPDCNKVTGSNVGVKQKVLESLYLEMRKCFARSQFSVQLHLSSVLQRLRGGIVQVTLALVLLHGLSGQTTSLAMHLQSCAEKRQWCLL